MVADDFSYGNNMQFSNLNAIKKLAKLGTVTLKISDGIYAKLIYFLVYQRKHTGLATIQREHYFPLVLTKHRLLSMEIQQLHLS